MRKYVTLALLLCSLSAIAQKQPVRDDCATTPSRYFSPDVQLVQQSRLQYTTPYLMKLFIHICADDNGANLAVNNATAFNEYVEGTRQFYASSGICFILMGIDTIRSTALNYMRIDNATDYNLLTDSRVSGCINVFFHKTLADADGGFNGNAYDIPNNFCSILGGLVGSANTSTLAHEMGHDFGLYHTFARANNTSETVPRSGSQSNCTVAGDLLCDTNADPGIGGSDVNNSCVYTGGESDSLDNAYNPPVRNLMTYGNFSCRNMFTAQQNARMESFIITNAKLTPSIAPDNIVNNTNSTITSGTHTYGARTNVTIQPGSSFVTNSTAKVYFSAGNSITLKAGVTLQPGVNGLASVHTDGICP